MKLLLVILIMTQGFFCFAEKSESSEMSIFNHSSLWKNALGEEKKLKHFFSGQPTLIAMVYTSCQHTCPMIISKIQSIQKELPKSKQKKIHLALISFDPERDTPEHLKKYKKKRKLSEEWSLLTGSPKEVRRLAAMLGVRYKKEKNGDFSHSNFVTLVNSKGEIKGQIKNLGQDTNKIVKQVIKLLK